MTWRGQLLAIGAATGLSLGRALDGLGLLPGVHESPPVRAAALSPAWTVAGLIACVLLGEGAARLLQRRRDLAFGVLLLGQVLVLTAPELAGRGGAEHPGGEAPLVLAVAVQLAVCLLTVSTALLVLRLVSATRARPRRPDLVRGGSAGSVPAVRRTPPVLGGVGGRAPPLRLLPPVPQPLSPRRTMSRTTLRRGLAAAALLPLLAGLSACGSGSSSDPDAGAASEATKACGTLPTADPAAKLPAGLPERDQVLYEPSTQGKTSIVFGLVDESDFVEVRDSYVEKLKAAGWTIDGTDQESVEAEAQFSKMAPGLISGTVKVQPLCKGYVTVRYKLNS